MDNLTVGQLRDILSSHDDDTIVKIAVGSFNGLTQVSDFGYLTTSTEEVYGKEIVIHPSMKAR